MKNTDLLFVMIYTQISKIRFSVETQHLNDYQV